MLKHIQTNFKSLIAGLGILFLLLFCSSNLLANGTQGQSDALATGCAQLFVDISTACLIPCEGSDYFVQYCNIGDTLAEGAYIEILFDETLIVNNASIPFIPIGTNTFSFPVGNLQPGECGSFSINIEVDCDATPGQAHCVEAHIFPDVLCNSPSPVWDGSDVEVEIECQGDSIYFFIENTGNGNMGEPGHFFIIEDDVIVMLQGYQLDSGMDTVVVIANTGSGYHFEATQSEGNPSSFFASTTIEGCLNLNTGFLPQFPEDDLNPAIDISCISNTPSCISNFKMGFPTGVGPNNEIGSNQPIEFQINFENSLSDSVINLTICDTLSSFLDTSTLLAGASSHDYVVEFPDSNVVKFVFNDILLPPTGSGFIKFTIYQKEDNPICPPIENTASIVFDSTQIQTNTISYNIPPNTCDTVFTNETITICGDGGYLGISITGDTTLTFINDFSFFTSSTTIEIIHFSGMEDVIEEVEICEGETITIEGQEINSGGTYTFPMVDANGCPYNLIVIVTLLENDETITEAEICFADTPYNFFGQALYTSGIYSHVVPSDPCFEINILELIVHQADTMDLDTFICQGDTAFWEGHILTTDTTLIEIYTNQNGCDSFEIIYLTVHPHEETMIDTSICEGEFFTVGDSLYYEMGSYVDTLQTIYGCDSIVYLDLSILPHSDSSLVALICEGETYPIGNQNYSSSGTYIDTLVSANGCDSVVTLQLIVQSKDTTCIAEAGLDTIICGYEYELFGFPTPGTWEVVCATAPDDVELQQGNNGQASVTVGQCGSYDFIFTHTHIDTIIVYDSVSMDTAIMLDTCIASDLVTIGFEDPSNRSIEMSTDLSLGYNDYDCHAGNLTTCLNSIPFDLTLPEALWKFNAEGSCRSEIYSTNSNDPLGGCLFGEIEVSTSIFEDEFTLPPLCLSQSDFVTVDSNGEIIENNFLAILSQLLGQGANSINCPPPPPACFPPPPCQADTLGFDTSYIEIPVRTGGQWTYLPDPATNTPLMDTTDLTINNIDYRFIIEPNANSYSPVIFSIWEILPNGDLEQPFDEVAITLQWQDIWVLDSFEIITAILDELPDSCKVPCARGDSFSNQLSDIPLPPEFDCPPFTLTFGSSDITVETNILCDTATYQVELFIVGGTPPYSISGLAGDFISTDHFLSLPIPGAEGFNAVVTDSAGCIESVQDDGCPCVIIDISTLPSHELSCLDSCTMMVADVLSNIDYYEVEWQHFNSLAYGEIVENCEEGTYRVWAYDPYTYCEDEVYTEATFDHPEAYAGEDQALNCIDTKALLTGEELSGDAPIIFTWEGPEVDSTSQSLSNIWAELPGNYELTVTNTETGCTDTDTVLVDQEVVPPLADAGEDLRFSCDTESILIDGSASSTGAIFLWQTTNGSILSGATTPTPEVGLPGTYFLQVTDQSNGCEAADTILIEEYEPVEFELWNQADCTNSEEGMIKVNEVSGFAGPYLFALDSLEFQSNTTFADLSNGQYILTVRDTNGCEETESVNIELIPAIPALILDETYHFCGINDTVFIDATLDIDPQWVSYFWSNGWDQPSILLNEQGSYFLEISTDCEVLEYDFQLVDDLANAALFEVPNVFTPNNDGVNDTFRPITPETNMPTQFDMMIFDRWGNKVYHTRQFDRPWDGMENGKASPSDVYIWKVSFAYVDCDGELQSFSLRGNVTLLR